MRDRDSVCRRVLVLQTKLEKKFSSWWPCSSIEVCLVEGDVIGAFNVAQSGVKILDNAVCASVSKEQSKKCVTVKFGNMFS